MILDYLSSDIKRLIYKEIHTDYIVKLHIELFSLLEWDVNDNYYYENDNDHDACFNMRRYEQGKWTLPNGNVTVVGIMTIIHNGKLIWARVGPLVKNY